MALPPRGGHNFTMGKVRNQLAKVRFKCADCGYNFQAEPAAIIDAPEDAWHPWRYESPCPVCGTTAQQDPSERALLKAWASATGPKSAEGKAKVTENLAGHPTPEAAQRTRFNALKHGLDARTATFWPARPGRYAQCTTCDLLDNGCTTAMACQKKTELFMRHHVAFKSGDPALLARYRADLHANMTAIVEDLILSIIAKGAVLETPEWFFDKDGSFHLAQYIDPITQQPVQIYKLEAHPAIKLVGELVTRFGLDLNSQGMTPKVQDDNDVVRGYLDAGKDAAGTMLEHQQRQTLALEGLAGMIQRSRERTLRDPVLIEHNQQDAHGG